MKIRNWNSNLKIRLFGEFFTYASLWMIIPFLILYFHEEFGSALTAWLLLLSSIISATANLLGGYFADRYGRRKMLLISSLGQAIVLTIFAFSFFYHPLITFVCSIFYNILNGSYYSPSQAIVADTVDTEKQTEVFAVFYTTMNLAVVVGAVMGGLFISNYRFEMYIIASILHLLLGFAFFKWGSETTPDFSNEEKQFTSWKQVIVDQLSSYRLVFTHKVFLLFVVAGVLITLVASQSDILLPIFIKDLFPDGLTLQLFSFNAIQLNAENMFSITLAQNGLLVIMFTILITKMIVKKFSEKNVFVVSCLLYGAAMIYLGFTASLMGILIAVLIFTVAEMMIANIQLSFIAKIAPVALRAKYFAAASLQHTASRMIAPFGILLSAQVGFTWTFLVFALLAVVAAVLYYLVYSIENVTVRSMD